MQKAKPKWLNIIFISLYHLALITLMPYYLWHDTPSSGMLVATFTLYFLTGLSITMGYHRLYSHKAFKTNNFIESIILFFGTMTAQNSVLHWAQQHRQHHMYSDQELDPYSITRGFMHAHIGWLFRYTGQTDKVLIHDLLKKPLLVFQRNYYVTLFLVTNAIPILFFGWLFNDYLGSFLFVGLLRLFITHHSTFFVNSLAHTWGARHFSRESTAADNFIVALLTIGEGYHNFHHCFPSDYRNGVKWYHFDPTKWIISILHRLGLAKNLKKTEDRVIEKMILKSRFSELMERLNYKTSLDATVYLEKVEGMYHELVDAFSAYHQSKVTPAVESAKDYLSEKYTEWEELSKMICQHSLLPPRSESLDHPELSY